MITACVSLRRCGAHTLLLLSLASLLPGSIQAGQPRAPAFPAAGQTPDPAAAFSRLPNLLQNASFEMDWMQNAVTARSRFHLLHHSDWGYGQADGLPDSWVVSQGGALDRAAAWHGRAALRLADGDAWQVAYLCGETDPAGGGAYYNPFRPLPPALLANLRTGTLRFGVWCRTRLSRPIQYMSTGCYALGRGQSQRPEP